MKYDLPDRIILGQNQFFGINHMSAARGAYTAQYFSDTDRIIDIIRYAYSIGVGGVMFSTNPRIEEITSILRRDEELAKNLHIYVLLPYMAKYVREANEKGLVNVMFDRLNSAGWSDRLNIAIKGGIGLISQDSFSMLKALIDIELLPFKGLNIKAVFLHNALTDLTVALRLSGVIKLFHDYIATTYNISPAFCTLTSGLSMKYIQEIGIENPMIMAPFNSVGFQMSPSKEKCEEVLREMPARVIAMSVLAAGHIKPDKACAYLATLPEIKSVIIGASSKSHIDESFSLIKKIVLKE